MTQVSSNAVGILRGTALQRTPLRLGGARTPAPPPPDQAAIQASVQEQALREGFAQALGEGREEGLRSGRADGLREGRAQAAEEIRQAVQRAVAEAERPWKAEHDRLQQIAGHARDAMADLLSAAQEELAALCFETLCRTLGATALQPEFVRAQLAHSIELHGGPDVVLHVHPQDAELLARGQESPPARALRWVADPEITLGGCILKASSGALDARLETMLVACKSALLEARSRQRLSPGTREVA